MVLVLKKMKGVGLDKDGLGLEILKNLQGLVLQVMILTTSLKFSING